MGIEKNIKASFRGVKLDMIALKNQVLRIAEAQNELKQAVEKLQNKKSIGSKKKTKKSKR